MTKTLRITDADLGPTSERELNCYSPEEIAEGNEWEQWKMRVWNQMARHFGHHPGLAPLEQWMRRSRKERRCIICGEPGVKEVKSVLIACVPSYWTCAECGKEEVGMVADGLEVDA